MNRHLPDHLSCHLIIRRRHRHLVLDVDHDQVDQVDQGDQDDQDDQDVDHDQDDQGDQGDQDDHQVLVVFGRRSSAPLLLILSLILFAMLAILLEAPRSYHG